MKTLRRALKLLPPAFLMRIWLDRRHGIKVPPAPGGAMARFLLAVLPYAFTAALSIRVESDCRLMKYFLPYGRMKRFVRLMYAMQVGNDGKDHGVAGRFRAIMPYGLVLWWDAEDSRIAQNTPAHRPPARKPNKAPVSSDFTLNFGWQMPERERLVFQRMDRIEAMTLRNLIMTDEKERRTMATADLPSFEDVFFKTPANKAWDKWCIMDDKRLEVDMIFSVGGDCLAASQQKNRKLRPYALPFDWCFSDGESALANFASMLDNGFCDFALKENLQEISGVRLGYKDVKSGYSFVHHFKAPIGTTGEYERFNETLRRRIKRFYSEIERSHVILCLLSRSCELKDSCLDPLAQVLKRKWPDKRFYFAIVTYNSKPPLIEVKNDNILIVRIPRDRTAYDMNERVFEWSFLDNVRFSGDAVAHFKAMEAQESGCTDSAQH